MVIAVAGPYSSSDPLMETVNLERLNIAAAELLRRGHTPIVGVNAALPAVQQSSDAERYEHIMRISMATLLCCEAMLFLGPSPGALRERSIMESRGLAIYESLDAIPSEPHL